MSKILALDLATKTGWARNYGPEPRSGVVSFERLKATKKRAAVPIGFVYAEFDKWLACHTGELKPNLLCLEEPIGGGGGMAKLKICIGLWAVANAGAFNGEVETVSVKNSDLRSSFVGIKSAGKDDIIAMAKRKGYNPQDDNEADACLLLEYMLELKGLKQGGNDE